MHAQRNTAFMFFLILSIVAVYTYTSDKAEENKTSNQQIEVSSGTKSSDDNSDYSPEKLINIETDLHSLDISLKGGDIIRGDLKDQKQEINTDENFHLLRITPDYKYYVTSDIIVNQNNLRPEYTASGKIFKLNPNPDIDCANINDESKLAKLEVPLSYTDSNGTVYTKTFTFTQCKHIISVTHVINNISNDISVSLESKLIQSINAPANDSSTIMASAYRGSAYSTAKNKYEKISFEDIADETSRKDVANTKGGWVSMIQHYFATAWIGTDSDNTIFTQSDDNKSTAIIGIKTTPISVTAGPDSSIKIPNTLWIGPKIQSEMTQAAQYLNLTVDYGWLSVISEFLFKILNFIHSIVNNWGVSIIILTLLVRGLMYPLTKKQYVSMAKMRQLTPKLQAIKEKYANDRQKLSEETMRLYASEHVNPLGGCLPILIQMPIFIALYWTLMESTELRHSPFIFWIHDLSVMDPYYVLPLLYGITMFIIQRASMSTMTDPTQKKVMTVMTVVFTFMFCTFPAGLTLYWLVSNIVTLVQQTIIYKHLEKHGLREKTPKKK